MEQFTVLCQPSYGYINIQAVVAGRHEAYGAGLFIAVVDAESGEAAATKVGNAFQILGCPSLEFADMVQPAGDRFTVIGSTWDYSLNVVAAVAGEPVVAYHPSTMISRAFVRAVDAPSAEAAMQVVEKEHYAAMAESDY